MQTAAQNSKLKNTCSLAGLWHNQHGSEAEFSIDDHGRVSGTFRVKEPLHGRVMAYPLAGFASHNIITFCVSFPDYGSATSWAGQVAQTSEEGDVETIYTLWHMTVDVGSQTKKNLWKSIVCGADYFQRAANKLYPLMVTAPSHPTWESNK